MNYMGGVELQRAYYTVFCIFGLRVPDDGTTVTFYREIKLNIGGYFLPVLRIIVFFNQHLLEFL